MEDFGTKISAERRRCPEGFFQCGTGHCLPENRVCDGYSDCPDASDEENCQRRKFIWCCDCIVHYILGLCFF